MSTYYYRKIKKTLASDIFFIMVIEFVLVRTLWIELYLWWKIKLMIQIDTPRNYTVDRKIYQCYFFHESLIIWLVNNSFLLSSLVLFLTYLLRL